MLQTLKLFTGIVTMLFIKMLLSLSVSLMCIFYKGTIAMIYLARLVVDVVKK